MAQAAVPSVLSLQPAHAFTAGTVLVLPVYFAMIAFPSSKAVRNREAQIRDEPCLQDFLLGALRDSEGQGGKR